MNSHDLHINPAFLDTFDLQRERGNSRDEKSVFELEESIGNGIEEVSESSNVVVSAHLESVQDGIYLSGSAPVKIDSICSKCGKSSTRSTKVPLSAFYLYEDKITDDDIDDLMDEYFLLEERYIDLIQLLRDSLCDVFEYAPLCSKECRESPNVTTTKGDDEFLDPRFDILKGML